MREITIDEATGNLSEIVETLNRTGESVTLTCGGLPCADLTPRQVQAASTQKIKQEVFDRLAAIRPTLTKATDAEIREAIDEGRR